MDYPIEGNKKSEKFFTRLTSEVKNLFSTDEKSKKKVEELITEKTDEMFKLLLAVPLDRDKAEIFNRVRSRFEVYLDVKEADAEYYLSDLREAKIKAANPAPITEKDLVLYKEKYEMVSAISSPIRNLAIS